MLGRTVYSDTWVLSSGLNGKVFNLDGLAIGAYNVIVYSGKDASSKKLVVVR